MNLKRTTRELVAISCVALFLELAIIRWMSAEIRIFAYFKNLPLMAAFLGFGIGFWRYQQAERLFRWFPRLICCLVVIIAGALAFGITHVIFVDPREYFLLGAGFGDHAIASIPSLIQTTKALLVIVSIFFLTMATFAALAAKIGVLINQEDPLTGYSHNIVGSLLGIISFSLVSYLEWPPLLWLLLAFGLLLYFCREQRKHALIYYITALIFTFCAQHLNPAIWSPYYRINVVNSPSANRPHEIHLYVNYDGFQNIQDLSLTHLSSFPLERQAMSNRHYNLPYALSRGQIESVLILGGGAGNDAAAAIRNGAKQVDVVEIDPAIARIGREVHPEKPYSSGFVHLHVEDARSFLQRTEKKYDLVVFATLDSHTVFSSLSSLRLDNFVFTRESLESARNHLKPGGGIAINFFTIKPWLSQRQFNALKEVMKSPPLAYGSPEIQEAILLAGQRFDASRDPGVTIYRPISSEFASTQVEPTSDDWPFLFLEKRGIPFHYLLPLFLILGLALIPLRKSQLKVSDVNWHLFFMGAAFLLIETKAVTTLALILGSTWMVNSIVIASIMVMILLANFLINQTARLGFPLLYGGLAASLIFNFFFSFDALNQFDWNTRVICSGCIIGSPLFFAALIFAKAFAVVQSPSVALASNLLGGLLGGLMEYLDMWVGLRYLNMLALSLYLISFVFLLPKMRGVKFSNTVPVPARLS